jgi:hypothetical protein
MRQAAAIYNVDEHAIRRRLNGILSRHDCEPNSKKLTKLEERAIVIHVLDLDSRGFAPQLIYVREMADYLLAERGNLVVGKRWPHNFIKRTEEIETKYNRKYDYQRARCEDPAIIQPWFDLVRNFKAKHGITDEDTYNFDETGFQMGVSSASKVVTGSERRSEAKTVQPGNREWVTVIQGVNSRGWPIPPFIIFAGVYHLSCWYQGNDLLPGSKITLSDNGWTTNAIGVDWLEHFDEYTKDRTVGVNRLLILDGHESHDSLKFQLLCKEKNILTLCMPAHASHLLQPLDVGCFAPLKRAYGREVDKLVKNHIFHVTKVDFLPLFKAAYLASITESNIHGGFRGTGLIPFDPDVVLSRLNVRLQTPELPTETTLWEPQTPNNVIELDSQSTHLRRRIEQHQNSSPTSILEALDQLTKGASMMVHAGVLIRTQLANLQQANESLSERKKRKKKQIQRLGTLSQAEGAAIVAQADVDTQIMVEVGSSKRRGADGPRQPRRCGRCRQTGHNARKCIQAEAEASHLSTNSSNDS